MLSTRTLLQLLGLMGLLWAVGALPIQCGGATVVFRSDPKYLYDNVRHLSGVMRGRVTLAAREHDLPLPGEEGDVRLRPLSGMRVAVNAQAHGRPLAVRRVVEVSPTGTFEVFGLPEGTGTVIVQLGSGAEIWRAEGVPCGRDVPLDPRLDPIRLGESLHWFELRIFEESGAPARAGHLVWREARSGADGERAFEGDAAIEGGRAIFAATGPCLDVVPLVPGAATELFEGLFGDEELHLGPGVRAAFNATGPLPDSEKWSVRLSLRPVGLEPAVEYPTDRPGTGVLEGPQVVVLHGREAELSLARGGEYALAWWVAPLDAREEVTFRIDGSPVSLEIPSEPGRHTIGVEFPMTAFQARVDSGR
jgi:hypothetical protein